MQNQQLTARCLNSVHYKSTCPIAGYLLAVLHTCLSAYPHICATAYRHSHQATQPPNHMPYGQSKIFGLSLLNHQTDPEPPGMLKELYAKGFFFRVWKDSCVEFLCCYTSLEGRPETCHLEKVLSFCVHTFIGGISAFSFFFILLEQWLQCDESISASGGQ